MRQLKPFVAACLLPFFTCNCTSSDDALAPTPNGAEGCDIAIIGAGVGGLHTAYRLAPQHGNKVCVFEKEDRIGGRLYDIGKTPEDEAAGLVVGNGGRRIVETQSVLFALAKELEISYDTPDTGADIIFAKGMYGTSTDDFAKLYPGLKYDPIKPDIETQLLKQLIDSPERMKIAAYANFAAYAKAVVGDAGFEYLHDMSRFRGDFEYPLSASAYVDFLAEEIDVCCKTSYPKGGMTSFPKKMAARAEAAGVRIFTGEAVNAIDKSADGYALTTTKRTVATKQVIVTVTPNSMSHIGGTVSDQIKATEQFKSLVGIKVTVINQWFDTPWWKEIKTADGRGIWRAYTTADASKKDGSCIGFVEIPPEKYVANANVIRVVYNDQKECADAWSQLNANKNDAERDRRLHEGLVLLFSRNGITTPVTIPPAVKTTYWEWPDGWHWITAGSTFSNADIFAWALEPLPGEDVALVGESYNPQRSTWSDGAYKSSIHLLQKRYGIN